jgi:Protein of unknown function (DUF2550)
VPQPAGLVPTLLTDSGLLALAVLVLTALVLVALAVRSRWITRYGGTFECCYAPGDRSRFRRGIARYNGGRLECFRWLSLLLVPNLVVDRDDVLDTSRRAPRAREAYLLGIDSPVVVRIELRSGAALLALDESSLTGLLSWVDSAPPRPFVVD